MARRIYHRIPRLLKDRGVTLRVAFLVIVSISAALAQQASRPVSVAEGSANLPTQAIGPNDLIAVAIYDAPELSRSIRVGADGFIRLPMLKQRLKAQGLYPSELETTIVAALREESILVDPFVTVTIAQYQSRPVSVAGAVKMPLVFQAESAVTLLEAIARAQGLREDAGREILVSRSQPGPDGKPVMLTRRVSVRGLIDDADPALNLVLTGGEEIRVPEVSKIYIMGNVKKPGAFPVQDGSDTTIMQMLALAEGLMPFASKEAFIYRRETAGPKNEIPVPLDKIMKRQAPDVILTANDILYIPDNSGKRFRVSALEKLLLFGGAAGAALIYTLR
jgi:polysaccharide export outer membrane protein